MVVTFFILSSSFSAKAHCRASKDPKRRTVEVDLTESSPVASELLELHTLESQLPSIDKIVTDSNKFVPKLKIAVLVVGTRGDVQPFLAMAKRLQA